VTRLTVNLTWRAKSGTSMRWYWEDSDKPVRGDARTFYAADRRDLPMPDIHTALRFLGFGLTTVGNVIRNARPQDSANGDRSEFPKETEEAQPLDTVD
jgi:hypothetical protein